MVRVSSESMIAVMISSELWLNNATRSFSSLSFFLSLFGAFSEPSESDSSKSPKTLNYFFWVTTASSTNFILEISGKGDFESCKCKNVSARI